MKYFETFLFIVFIVTPICLFFYNKFWINKNFFKFTNFVKFYVSFRKKITISIIPKHVNIFKFIFLYYKLQVLFKQHIHYITFTCKRFINLKQTLNFDKHKIEKIK